MSSTSAPTHRRSISPRPARRPTRPRQEPRVPERHRLRRASGRLVRPRGPPRRETTVALDLPGVAVEACKSYSVFAIGSAASPAVGDNALQVVVAVDGTTSPDTPAVPATDTLGSDQAAPATVRPPGCCRRRPGITRAPARPPREGPRRGAGARGGSRTRDPRRSRPGPPDRRHDHDAHQLIDDAARDGGRPELHPHRVRGPAAAVRLVRPASRRPPRSDGPHHRTDLRPGAGGGRRLAGLGARLILVGRSQAGSWPSATSWPPRTARTVRDPSSPTWRPSARSGRQPIGSPRTKPRLDVVIDNAGAIFPERTESPDGFESTLRDDGRRAVRARRRAAAAASTDRRAASSP